MLSLYVDFKHYSKPGKTNDRRCNREKFKECIFNSVILADFVVQKLKYTDIDKEFLSYIILLHLTQHKYNSIFLQDLVFDQDMQHIGYDAYASGVRVG